MLNKYTHNLALLLLITFLIALTNLGFATELQVEANEEKGSTEAATKETSEKNPAKAELPLKELRLFAEIFTQIKAAYVEEVSDQQLLEAAIEGMLNGLDPHSAYLTSEDYQELKKNTEGEIIGVGIEIAQDESYIKVVTPIDESPAAKAGIQAGDLIIKVNDKSTYKQSLNQVRKQLEGKLDTQVEVTLQRANHAEPLVFTLKRSKIKLASVTHKLLAENLGYVRLSQFQKQTAQEVATAIEQLEKSNKASLQGLVLDLRNNPGGVLEAAAETADLFISEGMLVYTQGRLENSYMEFLATPQVDILVGKPLVVLINSGSASAAEILAGALQDHKRGLVVGTSSFGKGSVQSLAPLPSGRGLKLTTALYYTPKGRSIQAEGIQPDITLAQGSLKLATTNHTTKEASLNRHLGNQQVASKQPATSPEVAEDLSDDYQLFSALNLLKGLVLQANN